MFFRGSDRVSLIVKDSSSPLGYRLAEVCLGDCSQRSLITDISTHWLQPHMDVAAVNIKNSPEITVTLTSNRSVSSVLNTGCGWVAVGSFGNLAQRYAIDTFIGEDFALFPEFNVNSGSTRVAYGPRYTMNVRASLANYRWNQIFTGGVIPQTATSQVAAPGCCWYDKASSNCGGMVLRSNSALKNVAGLGVDTIAIVGCINAVPAKVGNFIMNGFGEGSSNYELTKIDATDASDYDRKYPQGWQEATGTASGQLEGPRDNYSKPPDVIRSLGTKTIGRASYDIYLVSTNPVAVGPFGLHVLSNIRVIPCGNGWMSLPALGFWVKDRSQQATVRVFDYWVGYRDNALADLPA